MNRDFDNGCGARRKCRQMQVRKERDRFLHGSENLRTGLTIPKGAELLILMADRSIVSLYTDKAVTANTRYEYDEGNYLIKSSATIRYRLDASTAS